jgi:hypothetical protein
MCPVTLKAGDVRIRQRKPVRSLDRSGAAPRRNKQLSFGSRTISVRVLRIIVRDRGAGGGGRALVSASAANSSIRPRKSGGAACSSPGRRTSSRSRSSSFTMPLARVGAHRANGMLVSILGGAAFAAPGYGRPCPVVQTAARSVAPHLAPRSGSRRLHRNKPSPACETRPFRPVRYRARPRLRRHSDCGHSPEPPTARSGSSRDIWRCRASTDRCARRCRPRRIVPRIAGSARNCWRVGTGTNSRRAVSARSA